MKTTYPLIALVSGLWLSSYAQDLTSPTASLGLDSGASIGGQYFIASRDLNSRVWSRITWHTNADGVAIPRTNSYTELATGMAHWNGGKLVDSSPEITLTATGAVATNTQHAVTFFGNINSGTAGGAVTLIGSGGERLNTQILGLSYFDPVAQKSVWIGEVQDSQGELLPSQREALYPDAFSGDVVADILYVNSISGLEQLVLIRTQLPPPGDWGLDPASTMLQVITEFGSATPTPQVTAIASEVSDADSFLDFGSIQMGQGFAFVLGDETNRVRVTKHWAVLSGRTCLIEQVPFSEVAPLLEDLPPAPPTTGGTEPSTNSIIHRVASTIILPERKLARKTSTALKLATKPLDTKAFAMDFNTLTSFVESGRRH